MKNKLGKVLRAMLLTLTIVLMYSMNVSAASGQASIGSKNYATVQSALSAVQNGQTIRLNQDVTLKKTLFFKKNVKYTFDMNKHKVTSKITESNVGDFDVQAGNVTFTNGTTSAAIFVHEKANVTVKDGTYSQIDNWGKTTIKNGKIVNKVYSGICNYKGTLVINKVTARANSQTTYPLVFSRKATVYLKGGKYTATNASAVYNENGKITISGGNYSGNSGTHWGMITNCKTMSIKGGTFTNSGYLYALFCAEKSSTVVSGGKFTLQADVIRAAYGRKKLLVNGGTFKARAVLLCEFDDFNIKMDKNKMKLIGSTRISDGIF